MNTQKDIDRLFQEKLEGFEAQPRPEVWEQIEARLEKKKRRVLPMWWLYGSVAALLLLAYLLYPLFSGTSPQQIPEIPVIITEEPVKRPLDQPSLVVPVDTIHTSDDAPVEVATNSPQPRSKGGASGGVQTVTKITNIPKQRDTSTVIAYEKPSDAAKEGVVSDVPKSAMEKIFSTDISTVDNDSLQRVAKHSKAKKDFVKAMANKDSIDLPSKSKKSWSVAPVFAYTQANSFGNASPVDRSLNTTKTQGKDTFAYGLRVALQLDKKWTLQSGVILQKMGFSNRNLAVLSNVRNSALSGIEYEGEAVYLVNNSEITDKAVALNTANVSAQNAQLVQDYRYIEIPLEVQYTFLEGTRFRSKLVGGVSSLFLQQNQILLHTESSSRVLGKANNLNSINFSGNIGLDFQYDLNAKLQLSINPMFKVPFQTFSKNSNGFQPYNLGIYSGLIYQF